MALANESVARVTTSQAYPLETGRRAESQVEKAPVRKFNMISMWASVAVAVAAFWYIAGFGARIDSTNYQIDRLQSQIKVQTAENASLNAKVNTLKQPSRILQFALNHGYGYANPVTISAGAKH